MKLLLKSTRAAAGTMGQIVVEESPFVLGRGEGSHARLPQPEISGAHAAFHQADEEWFVEDLGSTNGTFLNGVRLAAPALLAPGDLLHFGTVGFKVVSSVRREPGNATAMIPADFARQVKDLSELHRVLDGGLLYPAFQPIVRIDDGAPIGWETLGRAPTNGNLNTGLLFELAGGDDRAAELSRAFFQCTRECVACGHCWPEGGRPHLFANLHPDEIRTPSFSDHLDSLGRSALARRFQLVLEFPEALVCKTREVKSWISRARFRGMLVAYDDFGRGQSRIPDLVDAPPDFLKLDRELVRDLDTSSTREILVKAVVQAAQDLGAVIIAEGVETPEEARACRDLGIPLAQGYHFARPAPAWQLFGADPAHLPSACPCHRGKSGYGPDLPEPAARSTV